MAWKKGPLPPETYQWGAVVPQWAGGDFFYFAEFLGDHCMINPGSPTAKKLAPEQVLFWDNSIVLPIELEGGDRIKGRAPAEGGGAT